MIAQRYPVVGILPPQMGDDQQGRQQAGGVEFRVFQQSEVRQHREQEHQRAVVFAVGQSRKAYCDEQDCQPIAPFRKIFITPQEQCGEQHQRPVGYGDEAVELQDGHCGRDQQEQSCIANRRLPGADDPPECEQVDGL